MICCTVVLYCCSECHFLHFLLLISKMPEREDDHLTPATRLLEKRREMSEVEQALAAQKEACRNVIIIILSKYFGFEILGKRR